MGRGAFRNLPFRNYRVSNGRLTSGKGAFTDQILTDGGLDAETVRNSVRPGDVVLVDGMLHRVVGIDDDRLRLYDLRPRAVQLKPASVGEVEESHARESPDEIDPLLERGSA